MSAVTGRGFALEPLEEEGAQQKPKPQASITRPVEPAELSNRIDDLERRMSQIENDLRFLDERTRNIDRRVDDLRRHHA